MEDGRRPSDNSFDLLVLGLPTIQELSFVAGRIEKPSAAISKDRVVEARGSYSGQPTKDAANRNTQ